MKNLKLGKVCLSITDGTHSTVVDDPTGKCYLLSCKNIKSGNIIITKNDRKISDSTLMQLRQRTKMEFGDVLLTTVGTIGQTGYIREINPNYEFQRSVAVLKPNKEIILSKYLNYYLSSPKGQLSIASRVKGAVQQCLFLSDLKDIDLDVVNIQEQQHIVNILGSIDEKIENNDLKISNLEQLLMDKFIKFSYEITEFEIKKAEDIFDISIGRTPPRHEQEWFQNVKTQNNVKWISISDMGNSKAFIFNTNEYLIKDAITNFNIPIIKTNTVILSFKLTVGRVNITTDDMLSNEAIAHFNTDNKLLLPYTYCYLKHFNYSDLGSTSSIATATNSKSIKNMLFNLPKDSDLNKFYNFGNPVLSKIFSLQRQNNKLNELKQLYLKKFFN